MISKPQVIASDKSFAKIFILLSIFTLSFTHIHNGPQPPAPSVNTELRMNEGTGTTLADGSGNGHTGTLTNGPTWVAGKYGQGINLDGTNDYIAIADHADYTLDPAQSYTWSAWVKNNSFKEWSCVWSQTLNNANFFYFYAHTSTDPDGGPVTNGISVYWWNNSGASKLGAHSTNNVLTLGQWSYVTITYNGTLAQANRFTIYINGTDVTDRSDVTSVGTIASINPANTRIGSDQPFGEYLNGAVDEVRYYRRLLSASEIQSDMNTGATDTQAPAVSLTAPVAGTVSGTVNVTANATDNTGVTGVQFLLDGVALGAEDVSSPYSVSWNTTTATNGSHTLTAKARDAAGNTTTSTAVNVTVSNDTQPPTVSLTAPASGNVNGTINVNATAADNVGVAGVQFLLDGANLGTEDVSSPYSVSWNTTTATNGSHTLTAKARDAAGNITTSSPVNVTVNNDTQAPTVNITSPAAGNVTGTLNITANATDNVGVVGVQFLLDGVNLGAEDISSPYSISWNSATVSDGAHTLTAKARDAAGNTTTSATVSLNVSNDTQAPTVSITTPAAGTVAGTLNVTATAADNVGVAGVQFLLDGVALGAEDLSSPYSVSWNTTTASNGSHTLTARARDAAGNTATSTTIAVTVNNDIQAPTVSITAPAAGAVTATVNVTANATDNVGVAGVQFLLDGVNLSAEDVSSPYSVSWNTTTATNGAHVLTAKARDAAGNITTSSAVNVTVNNAATTLLLALPLNDGTATTASDISGFNHPGTLTNGPTWVAGKYGQGVNLDGTNDYINVTDHADFTLDPTQKYTWSAWVKNTSFKEWSCVWSQTVSNTNFFYFYAHSSTDADAGPVTNGISVHWYTGNSKLGIHSTNNVLTAGQWSYVTVTYNGTLAQASRFTIYVNGTDVTDRSDVVSAGAITSLDPTNIRIGSDQPFGEYLNGAVDEVRYYKRLLTASEIVTDMNTPLGADVTAPTVSISAPAAGNVNGTINVTASATDNIGVAGVQFFLDGVALGAEDITSPYSISWNTTTAGIGNHILTAKARDAAGNTTTSSPVAVTVNNPDTEPPVVTVIAPPPGSVLGTIDVVATATDNVGVVGVQFFLDGVVLGTEDLSSPYSVTWNTSTTSNGSHVLTAKARDAAGNITVSAAVTVTVNNDTLAPAISITSPAAGIVAGTIDITTDATDDTGIAGVQFLLDGVNLGTEKTTAPYTISWNTTSASEGDHILTAKARDAAGNTTVSSGVTVTVRNVQPDTEAPVVSISAPAAGNVSGTINVNATATDNVGVIGVQFLLDGVNLSTEDLSSPYSASWNTTTTANGNHTLTAKARDAAGNVTTSDVVTITVNNDTEAPVISITAPDAGTVVGTINVNATATDNVGIVGVQFFLDGVALGAEDVSSPYSISWNTNNIADGNHIVTAKARDAAGNTTTSSEVPVFVLNHPADSEAPTVSITSPAAGNVSGTITVTADANDNVGVASVQFLVDGVNLGAEDFTFPYSISWNTTTVANGSHNITAKAKDEVGNLMSATVTVNVNNPDIQAPVVSITAPATGNVLGTINVTADATDNTAVVGVQFLLDGVALGAEDLSSPYSVSWTTTSVANGNHTLTAKARDAAGNTTTSSSVVVNVNNPDIIAPTVTMTAPASGTVTGTLNVTATATDNIGVAGVQFLLDGVALGAEDITSPYSISWTSTTTANGAHTLSARARDAAGNTTTSSLVNVTVNNVATGFLVALPLDDNTGTNAIDVSGSSHPGTLTNGPTWTTGKYGQGVNLDGTNDYIALADHADFTLDPTQKYTWSAWVKNNSFKEWSTVWSQTLNNANFFYFYAHTSTDPDAGPVTNGISVFWWNSSGTNKLGVHSNDNVLAVGQWSHITVTYDGSLVQASRFTIYVNGADVTNRSDIASAGTIASINPSNTRIGSNQPFGEYLNGAVDEVRFYKRLLSPAEIVTDMNTPLGGDNIAPTVSITVPAAGNVSGTTNVTATATDNAGVVGVQFLLDGVALGAEDLTSPYSISWNTTTATNGTHVLTAKARDAAGNTTTSSTVTVTVSNDSQAPTVSITSPSAGTVLGSVTVAANATDNVAVAGVQFLLDGVALGAEDVTAPYSVSWNTSLASNGSHTLTAKARDAAGNTTTSAGVVVTVNNPPDTEAPTVSITAPSPGNVVNTINVTAIASDNAGVVGVQFLLDGVNLGSEDITAPYSVSWNTTTSTAGNHILTAKARDAAGNTTTSLTVTVNVIIDNTLTITGVNVSGITTSSALINWTTSVAANSMVNYGTTNTYGLSTLIDPALVIAHTEIINGLTPGTVYHYQVISVDGNGTTVSSSDNTFTAGNTQTVGTINSHSVLADAGGKIIPWTTNPANGYVTVVTNAWNYLLNSVPNDPSTGKPAYYSRSYLDPNSQTVIDWPHNPAGLYGMLTESALKFYYYSNNTNVMQLAENVALWHLDHGMTLATDSWASVPYASGDAGSLTYGGAVFGNGGGQGDGVGFLQPDKIGELGFAWLQLYKYDGNVRFRDAAIQAANVLASKVRTGTLTQSPWPFRVNAHNNTVREDYCSNVVGPLSLLDGLIASGLGDTAAYRVARTTAWNWMMNFPMQNNVWAQYFEDVPIQSAYNSNFNQYNAMMTARYLLEHPEFDANWQTHVRGLITWVETTFGTTNSGYGATLIKEQTPIFPYPMGSHTSRYASVNALLYDKTGDAAAKEKAYRSFNWSTYMARTNGVDIDGPDVGNEWFTDGYGDYIRHFMTGLAAVPEWTPSNETHILRTSSVVKNITYGTNTVSYTSYDPVATEVLHVNFTPTSVTVDGVPLQKRTDLTQPGWTLDVSTKALRIYHTTGTQVVIDTGSDRAGRMVEMPEVFY